MSALIEAPRARLRRPRPSDFEKIRALESDAEIMRFTSMRVPQSEEQSRKRLEEQLAKQSEREPFGIWLAELKSSSEFVGWFMLMPRQELAPGAESQSGREDTDVLESRWMVLELGFMLVREFWNQGFATEISRALIDFARADGRVSEIVAKTDVANGASIRALEKAGFTYVNTVMAPESSPSAGAPLQVFSLKLA